MTVETPTVNWGEWPIVAIVLLVIIIVALGAWVVIRWLLNWQSAEAAKYREMLSSEAKLNRDWQEKLQSDWKMFMSTQRADDAVVMKELVTAIESIKAGFASLERKVDVHHAVVEEIAAQVEVNNGKTRKSGIR